MKEQTPKFGKNFEEKSFSGICDHTPNKKSSKRASNKHNEKISTNTKKNEVKNNKRKYI